MPIKTSFVFGDSRPSDRSDPKMYFSVSSFNDSFFAIIACVIDTAGRQQITRQTKSLDDAALKLSVNGFVWLRLTAPGSIPPINPINISGEILILELARNIIVTFIINGMLMSGFIYDGLSSLPGLFEYLLGRIYSRIMIGTIIKAEKVKKVAEYDIASLTDIYSKGWI